MIRNLLLWTAGCLFTAFAVSSCESDDVDYGPISAAISIDVEDVTPSSAKVTLSTEQKHVVSYKVVTPTPISEFEYAGHDAIDRLAFIEERGTAAEAPYQKALGNLLPKVEYSFAVVGLDAAGQIVTAPTFARFTTAYASSLVEARFEENPDATYTFTGKITPNEYTVSYRYIFNSDHNDATDAELRTLLEAGGSGVMTGEGVKNLEITKAEKVGVTLAVLSYDDAGRPGEFTSAFVSTEDMASVIVDGKETQLARRAEDVDIFEGKVAVGAKSEFTIEINKVSYGFAPYSGNGGVGKVENLMSAAPYYSSSKIADARGYECKKAVGRMQEGGNKFWTNLSDAVQLFVQVDLTYADGTPRYYLEVVETENPNILLEQNFDLFVWGGDYTLASGGKGTAPVAESNSAADLDGTEEGTAAGASYTTPVPDIWSTADGAADGDVIASDLYLKNRDVEGWEIRRVAEHPGMVRLNKSKSGSHIYSGHIKTPKLSKLTGATDITLEFDICRFAGDGDIYVTIEGAGTYTAGEVNIDGAATATTVNASGTDFVVTNDLCSKQANTVVNKPWSHVKLTIGGATAETQIKIDGSRGKDSAADRCLLDNIKITK